MRGDYRRGTGHHGRAGAVGYLLVRTLATSAAILGPGEPAATTNAKANTSKFVTVIPASTLDARAETYFATGRSM